MKNFNLKLKQKGFTLIEMMIVLVLVSLLAGWAYNAVSGSKEDARFAIAENEIKKSFPESIEKLLLRQPNCSGRTKAQLTSRGLDSNNVYGNAWTVTATTASTLTVRYPMRSAGDATEMRTRLTGNKAISSVSASSANLDIVYRCL